MSRNRVRAVAMVAALVVIVGGGAIAVVVRPWEPSPTCPPAADHPVWTVARRWDEALLGAIRRALPNPPVHARNLYHLSAAMWDAWATYDPDADGVFFTEKHTAPDTAAARNEAISYAAYRVLTARFIRAMGGEESLSEFANTMDALCYPLDVATTEGESPAAIGNRIAKTILDAGLADGSNQAGGYAPPDYTPVNPPLVVAESGATMTDPNRWQPLRIEHMISQNGIPVENGVQQAIGPHWGHVTSFALPAAGSSGVPIDPGPPPLFTNADGQAYRDAAVEVIWYSSQLDPRSGETIDISPGALGGNHLGTNDGHGHALNPATGQAYPANVVDRADFARALTEFWADGPKSETPPGHWNVVANSVSDELDPDLRIGGGGAAVDRLQWDVKLYLALNGSVHDAAIAAWGLKGFYDSVRPISMIRYLGGLGQSTDPALRLAYHPAGLPLVPGLVEVVTAETSAPGVRHEALAGHENEIAIRAWRGNPDDPRTATSGVGWILAVDWVPYQQATFVTPSFAGYVSGHSTFSRAAAEVLTGFTGSEFFPGGESSWTIRSGELKVEAGPKKDVTLEWATYYDAADQAGISRLYGGIHISADDFAGRTIGSQCGKEAWALAKRYFDGSAAP